MKEAGEFARAELVRALFETLDYLADGKVIAQDIGAQFSVPLYPARLLVQANALRLKQELENLFKGNQA